MLGLKHNSERTILEAEEKLQKMIPISMPQIDEKEIEMVVKVLKSGVLTAHLGNDPLVKRFESEFREKRVMEMMLK